MLVAPVNDPTAEARRYAPLMSYNAPVHRRSILGFAFYLPIAGALRSLARAGEQTVDWRVVGIRLDDGSVVEPPKRVILRHVGSGHFRLLVDGEAALRGTRESNSNGRVRYFVGDRTVAVGTYASNKCTVSDMEDSIKGLISDDPVLASKMESLLGRLS